MPDHVVEPGRVAGRATGGSDDKPGIVPLGKTGNRHGSFLARQGSLGGEQDNRESHHRAHPVLSTGAPVGGNPSFRHWLKEPLELSLIHISEPTRLGMISYAVF